MKRAKNDVHSEAHKTAKANINILQRLITTYEVGCTVDLSVILRHKRTLVLLGSKAILVRVQVLTHKLPCPHSLDATDLGDSATLVANGQALVFAIGKP